MRKIFYLAITYIICAMLGLGKIWLGFTPVFIALLLLRIPDSVWWEIPIAVLACGVAEAAFGDDMNVIIRILIPISSALIAYSRPKRLLMFFLIAITAIYYENIYALAATVATAWFGVREIFVKENVSEKYSTIKKVNLQG